MRKGPREIVALEHHPEDEARARHCTSLSMCLRIFNHLCFEKLTSYGLSSIIWSKMSSSSSVMCLSHTGEQTARRSSWGVASIRSWSVKFSISLSQIKHWGPDPVIETCPTVACWDGAAVTELHRNEEEAGRASIIIVPSAFPAVLSALRKSTGIVPMYWWNLSLCPFVSLINSRCNNPSLRDKIMSLQCLWMNLEKLPSIGLYFSSHKGICTSCGPDCVRNCF